MGLTDYLEHAANCHHPVPVGQDIKPVLMIWPNRDASLKLFAHDLIDCGLKYYLHPDGYSFA